MFTTESWKRDYSAFLQMARAEMVRTGHTPPTEEEVAVLAGTWGLEVQAEKFTNLADAFNSFHLWLESYQADHVTVLPIARMTVSFNYNVAKIQGQVTLEFEPQGSSLKDVICKAVRQAELAFDALGATYKLVESKPQGIGFVPSTPEPTNGTLTIECEALVHSFDGANHRIRAAGGQFRKWGVPVYPEVLRSIGMDENKLPMGETAYKRQMIISVKPDGKPEKVLRFL